MGSLHRFGSKVCHFIIEIFVRMLIVLGNLGWVYFTQVDSDPLSIFRRWLLWECIFNKRIGRTENSVDDYFRVIF